MDDTPQAPQPPDDAPPLQSNSGPRRLTDQQLGNRFLPHAPDAGTSSLHEDASLATLEMAKVVRDTTKPSREQALTLTALEEVRMRWNQAIALDGAGLKANER